MFIKKEEIGIKQQMEKMKPLEIKDRSDNSTNKDENLEPGLIEKES